MAKKMNDSTIYRLQSTEWAIPLWGFVGIGVAMMALFTLLARVLDKAQLALVMNSFFAFTIIVLFVFYKRLYTSRVTVQASEAEGISIVFYKIFGRKQMQFPLTALTAIGRGEQEEIKGMFTITGRTFVQLKFGRRSYFLFSTGKEGAQAAALFSRLKFLRPDVPIEEKAFEK